MDTLVTAALVGTARQRPPDEMGGAPTDALVGRLPELSAERRVLLRAGARATYRAAGYMASPAIAALAPAPGETRAVCAPVAATLVTGMLGGDNAEILPEALRRMRRARQILPPDALVAALSVRAEVIAGARDDLADVLGERGRWLAALNPAWQWVRDTLAEREPPQADAATIWETGLLRARRSIFRRMRQADPARAREWLAATWAREKADVRSEWVELLAVGLAPADEPLLTQALADKSANVRLAAARLLARLPGSAFAMRMVARGKTLLNVVDGALAAKPPITLPVDWARDGIVEHPPYTSGKRAWWLMQVLTLIPPSHWLDRFAATPAQLVAAAASDSEAALIEGWSRAALAFRHAGWAEALWEWWLVPPSQVTLTGEDSETVRDALAALMPRMATEARVGRLFDDPNDRAQANRDALVAALPRPWSAAFGMRYLSAARAAAAGTDGKADGTQADPLGWTDSMQAAGLALPSACFAAALAPWEVREPEQKPGERWQRYIEGLTDTVSVRQRLVDAIPLEDASEE